MLRTSEAVIARLTSLVVACQQLRCGVEIDAATLDDLVADVAEAYRREQQYQARIARMDPSYDDDGST